MAVIKNTFFLFIMQCANYGILLLTVPYLTRTLGVYNFGVLNTALTIVQYLILFTDFGFNLSATKQISENKHNVLFVNRIFWLTVQSKVMIFTIGFLSSIIILMLSKKYYSIISVYLCFLPQMLGSIFFPVWFLQGVEKISNLSIITVLSKLIVLPLLFIFVKNSQDIHSAAFIFSLPLFLSTLLSIREIKKSGISLNLVLSFKKIFSHIKGSSGYFFGNVAISIYTLSTPLILSFFSTYQNVGYYSAADKIRMAMLGIFLVLGQAIYPRAVFLIRSNYKSYTIFFKELLIIQIIICSIATVIFYRFVPEISIFLFGSKFSNVGILIKIMSPMILLIPTSVVLANCLILPNNKIKPYAIIPWITAIIHIPYACLLCYKYGAIGGSIAILITEIISFLLLTIYCFKSGLVRKVFFNE